MDLGIKVIPITKESCVDIAEELFQINSGLNRPGKKQDRIREQSLRIRQVIDSFINPRAVYKYYQDVVLTGKEAVIGGRSFSCNAWDQVDPKVVKGAYVYVLTAGDFHLGDEEPIMDQLLADLWGTAFTDGARRQLEAELRNKSNLSNGFGPGFYGMDVRQMEDIFALVDGRAIDVELKSSSIIVPLKSCAGIYLDVTDEYVTISNECEDCRGTVLSCVMCNVNKANKKPKMVKDKENKMFKCTGVCSKCGRCKNAGMIAGANKRKTKILTLPDDFVPDTKEQGYGVAFDIGTTTVVGMIVDLFTGKHLHSIAKTNPQNKHGLDVISRITYANESAENLNELKDSITQCLNEIIGELCESTEVDKEAIVRVTICGNTTMSHIIGGFSPKTLAVSPFAPAYTGTLMVKANEAGLNISPNGDVMIFPNIAGHVGGDITSGLLATRFLANKGLTLFIDIGTNGEIALTDGEKTLACSTAAGPAFEGSAIYQGMRAAAGAIEKIEIDEEKVLFQTIENIEPMGICGSGLIDAMAQMIKAGLVKKTGRLLSREEYINKYNNSLIGDRIRDKDGVREFVLVYKEHGEDIVITQNDVREVQLAKGAISAGINIMVDMLGKEPSQIEKVIVAGAFGNFIDKVSAITIGLLPNIEESKILSAGNTAGAGALMAVTNAEEAIEAKRIPEVVDHVELAEADDFQNKYIAAMSF